MIQAKVIADSVNKQGNRITTIICIFPRYILAELNTHRMFSRNSASSRAIPFNKMVESAEKTPFIPMAWQKDHKGMQGNEYITDKNHLDVIVSDWLEARDYNIKQAKRLSGGFQIEPGKPDEMEDCVTKQLCNRLLEPFIYHTCIITATEWENFFALRCPQYELFSENMPMSFRSKKDLNKYVEKVGDDPYNLTDLEWLQINKGMADIHIMALAESIWDVMNESTPKELKAGEWHIPFEDKIILPSPIPIDEGYTLEEGVNIRKVKIATAMCARVSYTVVGEEGKEPNHDNDIMLHDRLSKSGHWSPFEHCAKCMGDNFPVYKNMWSGNFRGFIQYRKMFNNENITI